SGRAGADRRRHRDRGDDHQARRGARRRADRRAGGVSDRARGRRRRGLRARRGGRGRAARAGAAVAVLPAAVHGWRHLRREARSRGSHARPVPSGGGGEPGPCALAAHRRPRGARRAAGDDLARARRERSIRAPGGAAARRPAHDLRGMVARAEVSAARKAAYEVVLRVFEDDAYADRVLAVAAARLDRRDRALAQQIAYGTVQRVRALDYGIEALGRRPVRKLDPPVRAALRLGAYQLGYLDIAEHAAVNESVELVRAARLERAVPFTNAVMRRLATGLRELLESLPAGPLAESYPDWIYETWVRDWGEEEALALMRAQNEPAETVVRLVRGQIDGEPTDVPGAYRVARVDEAALAEGRIWPQ